MCIYCIYIYILKWKQDGRLMGFNQQEVWQHKTNYARDTMGYRRI